MNAGARTGATTEDHAPSGKPVFLTAPKDLQQDAAYEAVLERLYARFGADKVLADRDLFDGTKDWKARWREVYGEAGRLYVLVRQDGTVGLGVWKQTRWLQKRGVPTVAILENGRGTEEDAAGGVEHEGFVLQRLEHEREDGEEDPVRFARVSLEGTEEPDDEAAGRTSAEAPRPAAEAAAGRGPTPEVA